MQLSEHFSLDELIHSETAEARGIANLPPPGLLDNAYILAAGLERARAVIDAPMRPNSGYRCEQLERIIAQRGYSAWCHRHGKVVCEMSWREYFARKDHPKFLALDFTAPKFGTPYEVVKKLAEHAQEIGFQQCIMENTWVHISFPEAGKTPKLEILTADATGTSFTKGLA